MCALRPPRRDCRLHIKVLHLKRMRLNEVAARLHYIAHKNGEHIVGASGVSDVDLQEGTLLRVHRGLPELLGVHLAKALVAL